jgi:hypothetical protein
MDCEAKEPHNILFKAKVTTVQRGEGKAYLFTKNTKREL